MTAQKDAARDMASHGFNRRSKTGLISFTASAWRWTMRPGLAERKIAAKHSQAYGAEPVRQRNKERSVAVRSGAVCQYEAIGAGNVWVMQKPSHGCLFSRIVEEVAIVTHTQDLRSDYAAG